MANSTLYRQTRSAILLFLLLCACFSVHAQHEFYKVYPSQDYQNVSDLLAVDEHNYVFITTTGFYQIDDAGNVKTQKELKQGTYSQLESVIIDNEGNFWIASIVFDDVNTTRKVLYKLNSNGQLLNTISINDPESFENLRLTPSSNNNFFLSYKARGTNGNAAIRVALLNKNGNRLWEKQSTDTIYFNYLVKSGPGNSADIFYEHIEDRQSELVNIDATGKIIKQSIKITDASDEAHYTSDFHRVNDGLVFSGVQQKGQQLNTDGLIYKTDAAGNLVWTKKMNIKLGDNFFKIEPVSDGFIVLGSSSITNTASDADGDILLLKFDLSGNHIWTRAFGGAKRDYARHLRVLNQHILFAGQSSYPGQSVSIPVVCKTDREGRLNATIPLPLEAAGKMKPLETPATMHSASLVQSAAGPEGSIISGGNLFSPDDDENYPFIICNDKNGKQVWHRQLSDYPASLKLFKQIRTNEYVAVTETKDLFANHYDVFMLDDKGKTIWQAVIGANSIKDAIATRDGGVLFTGTLDISFVNYETLLIKLGASGKEQWIKTIGDARIWETGRRIIETPEQDFLIVGNAQPEYDLVSSLLVLKVDRDGNKRWSKTFSDGVTTDLGYDVIITADQGYLFAGTTNKQPFTNKDLLLIKTDKNGNLLWKKTHDLYLMDEGFQLMNGNGGEILLTGITGEPQAGALEKFIFTLKLDDSGNRTGSAYFGKQGLQTMNPCLTLSSSGDTILTGTTQQQYGKETLFMVKLNGTITREESQEEFVKLYPNPTAGSSALWISNTTEGDISISIFDHTGKKIKDIQRKKTGIIFREDIAVPNLPAGIYYINVWLNGKCTTIKWLVLR